MEDENVPEKSEYVRGDIWTSGYIIEGGAEINEKQTSTITYVTALNLQGLLKISFSPIRKRVAVPALTWF